MNFTRDRSSGKEGFQWLDRILDIHPRAAVILFTAYGDVEMAVRAIKAGATDFVLKPWENEKLLDTVRAAVEEIDTDQDEHRSARESIEGGQEYAVSIIGESAGMTQLLDPEIGRATCRERVWTEG